MREILVVLSLVIGCGSTDSAAQFDPEPTPATGGAEATGGQSSVSDTATGGAETLATGGASEVAATGGALATGGAKATGGALSTGGSSIGQTGGAAATVGSRALSCGEKMCQGYTYADQAKAAGIPCVEFWDAQCAQYREMCSQVCG